MPKMARLAGKKKGPTFRRTCGPISQTLTQVLHLPCPSITQLIEVYTVKHKRAGRVCRKKCPCEVGISTTTKLPARRRSEDRLHVHDFWPKRLQVRVFKCHGAK